MKLTDKGARAAVAGRCSAHAQETAARDSDKAFAVALDAAKTAAQTPNVDGGE